MVSKYMIIISFSYSVSMFSFYHGKGKWKLVPGSFICKLFQTLKKKYIYIYALLITFPSRQKEDPIKISRKWQR